MTDPPLNAAIVVQARMGSSRLPGKTLKTLAGRRMLRHVVNRLAAAPVAGPLVVATSNHPGDDFIASWCEAAEVDCFRGSEDDVLDRFRRAAEPLDVDYIVRATADNPLVWEGAVGHLGRIIIEQRCQYVSYTHHMPLGLALEVFTKETLLRAAAEATEPHHREHVTAYIYDNRDRFDCLWISPPKELEGGFRLTIDTEEDFELMRQIYDRLYVPGEVLPTAEAVALLRREPRLAAINAHIRQKPHTESAGGKIET